MVYISTTMRNMFVMVAVIREMMKGVKISETNGSFKKIFNMSVVSLISGFINFRYFYTIYV
jgi:hypothetical protein